MIQPYLIRGPSFSASTPLSIIAAGGTSDGRGTGRGTSGIMFILTDISDAPRWSLGPTVCLTKA